MLTCPSARSSWAAARPSWARWMRDHRLGQPLASRETQNENPSIRCPARAAPSPSRSACSCGSVSWRLPAMPRSTPSRPRIRRTRPRGGLAGVTSRAACAVDLVLMNRCPCGCPLKAPTHGSFVACLGGRRKIAAASAGAAWTVRGATDARHLQTVLATAGPDRAAGGYAQRAAIAHAVYAPDMGRLEVDDNEKGLSRGWTKRMGAPARALLSRRL